MKKILIIVAFIVLGSMAWNYYKQQPSESPVIDTTSKAQPPIVGGMIYDRSGSSPANKVPVPSKSELLEWCNLTNQRDVFLFFGEIQSNSTQNFIRCHLPALKLDKPTKPDRSEFTSRQYTKALNEYKAQLQKYSQDSSAYFEKRNTIVRGFVGKIEAYFANITNYSSYTDIFTAIGIVNTIYNEFPESDNYLILLSDGQNTRTDIDSTSFNHVVYTIMVNGAGVKKTSVDNLVDAHMESFEGSIRALTNKFKL